MDGRNPDAVSAVVARQRGRARMRSATVALGAAGLVAAGVVAYHLPPGTHTVASTQVHGTTAASATGTAAHTTSGGSAVAGTASSTTSGGVSAPAASSGRAHATSGGS